MEALLAGMGFAQQLLALARAMGLDLGIVDDQTRRILEKLDDTNLSIEQLKQNIVSQSHAIKKMVTTAVVVEVQSRLPNVKNIPSDKLILLIRLIFCLKEKASNVVFAVFVKYQVGIRLATLGFAGGTSDRIEDIVMKVDSFLRTVSRVSAPKTVYASIKIRGKYDPDIESFCTAVLTTIVTDVCGLSRDVELEDKMKCVVTARGEKTIIMLEPSEIEEYREEFDRLRRVFLVGDTRSGKSTLGNALVKKKTFMISRGMTGTMRIERSELVQDIDYERWVTEFYDTPGLNDKDGLDVWYESAIEDHVRILQRASSFIMTVAVDAGITGSALRSLKSYKSLFGSSIPSMMIVVLTINESAGKDDLKSHLEVNIPTVLGLDETILEENIYCVSLYDLRGPKRSASHDVVKTIRNRCRSMPMKVIESLVIKYQQIRNALVLKSGNVKQEVQKMVDDGWQAYGNLSNMYEQSPYIKMTENNGGLMDGFVMKNRSKGNLSLAVATLGFVNIIRKVAIHVFPNGKKAERAWKNFLQENELNRHNSSMMRDFGDMLWNWGMGVIVKDLPVLFVGTLRVKRYKVVLFDPVHHTHEEIAVFAQEMIQEENQEVKPELIYDLMKAVLPSAIRTKTRRSFGS